MGWDGMGWDGMGWDGMGWDGMGTFFPSSLPSFLPSSCAYIPLLY
jgi:hypothetical protein